MTTIRRAILIGILTICGISGLIVFSMIFQLQTAGAMPAVTTTPSPTPTATATTTPVFTATLLIEPDRPEVTVGEILSLTVDIDVSAGCQYPVFELSVYQDKSEPPIFAHIDPPGEMITGPISIPSVWTFQASGAGTATFDARTFGERYCNDFWNWHYLSGESISIFVTHQVGTVWLPAISRR